MRLYTYAKKKPMVQFSFKKCLFNAWKFSHSFFFFIAKEYKKNGYIYNGKLFMQNNCTRRVYRFNVLDNNNNAKICKYMKVKVELLIHHKIFYHIPTTNKKGYHFMLWDKLCVLGFVCRIRYFIRGAVF